MLRSNYSHALKVSLRVSDEVVSEICRFRVHTGISYVFREDSFAFLGSPSKGRKKFFETSRSIRCADGKIEENIEQAAPIGFQRREYLALFSLSLSLSRYCVRLEFEAISPRQEWRERLYTITRIPTIAICFHVRAVGDNESRRDGSWFRCEYFRCCACTYTWERDRERVVLSTYGAADFSRNNDTQSDISVRGTGWLRLTLSWRTTAGRVLSALIHVTVSLFLFLPASRFPFHSRVLLCRSLVRSQLLGVRINSRHLHRRGAYNRLRWRLNCNFVKRNLLRLVFSFFENNFTSRSGRVFSLFSKIVKVRTLKNFLPRLNPSLNLEYWNFFFTTMFNTETTKAVKIYDFC